MDKVKEAITWAEFDKIDLRAATIVRAEKFPEARRPAYKIWADLGPLGIKKSSAQITEHYSVEELVGKQVVCVVNFGEKQIGPFISQILVTGFGDVNGNVVLATIDKKVPNGARLY